MTNIKNEELEKIATDIRRDIHDNSQFFKDTVEIESIEKDELNVITEITKLISKYSNIGVNTFNQENIFSKIIDSIVLKLGEQRGIPPERKNIPDQNVKNKTNANNSKQNSDGVKCPKCQHIFVP